MAVEEKQFPKDETGTLIQGLKRFNLLDKVQLNSWDSFGSSLEDIQVSSKSEEFQQAINITLNRKKGNSIGALCLAAKFHSVEDGNNFKNREHLCFALMSLQTLADLGDSYIDFKKDCSFEEIITLYSLNAQTEDNEVLSFLKGNILTLVENCSDLLLKKIFYQRWDEFVFYQICSAAESYESYQGLLDIYFERIVRDRKNLDLPHYRDPSRLEVMFSKGGTMYLHNLLRVMGTDFKCDTGWLTEFDEENLLVDMANFAADHICDFYTDQGFAGEEEFLDKNVLGSNKNLNALYLVFLERRRGKEFRSTNTIDELIQFYLEIVKKIQTVFNRDKKKITPNHYLLSPMLYYFFSNGQPSDRIAKAILYTVLPNASMEEEA